MNPLVLAQVQELARQMKEARRSGELARASKLEQTISVLNSYGQSCKTGRKQAR